VIVKGHREPAVDDHVVRGFLLRWQRARRQLDDLRDERVGRGMSGAACALPGSAPF
jgi:hypothetical protein